jgi:virulence-associated protein VagC
MTKTYVFQDGDAQAVRLPSGFEFATAEIAIRREGEAVILEPIKPSAWPDGFFDRIRIDDPAFTRPLQGIVPPAPEFGLS